MMNTPASGEYTTRTPLRHRVYYVVIRGFSTQSFLGQTWIPVLLSLAPKKLRRTLALRILGMSPHYFVHQWSNRYPRSMSRLEILEAENERNVSSRKALCESILQPRLAGGMTVLDFGCGPGYLAREAAKRCGRVEAVDISRGTIACAKALNAAPNIVYHVNTGRTLSFLDDSSVDLIYTFAVFQHLSDEDCRNYLQEFFRVLKPRGNVICHVPIGRNPEPRRPADRSPAFESIKKRCGLFFTYRSAEQIRAAIEAAGFGPPQITLGRDLGFSAEDDIANQEVFLFSRP